MQRTNIKDSQYNHIFRYLVNITCDRIKFDNLPEEIDDAFLRYQLLLYGKVLFLNTRTLTMYFGIQELEYIMSIILTRNFL